jgi:two-component system KDP operon response regulator KdpE
MSSTQYRVLIADENSTVPGLLHKPLGDAGFLVRNAYDASAALRVIRRGGADLVIVDLHLPPLGALEVVRLVREEGSPIPIIVLSGRAGEAAKVRALDLGADDFLTKPFGVEEFLARVRAVMRHRLKTRPDPLIFYCGDLTVDVARRIVKVRGAEVKLSGREYDLLRLLVVNAGKVVAHKDILRVIWDEGTNIQYLRIYIRSLRRKIEVTPKSPVHILTQGGFGYALCQGHWGPSSKVSPGSGIG